MTELEILAELKIAYNYLVDIEENANRNQIDEFFKIEILKMQDKINNIYIEIYQKIMREDNKKLYYQKNIKIGDNIYIDYTIEDAEIKESITYKDIENEAKWWEDYNFLI